MRSTTPELLKILFNTLFTGVYLALYIDNYDKKNDGPQEYCLFAPL